MRHDDDSERPKPSSTVTTADPAEYRAFEVADRAPDRLEIIPANGPSHFMAYANLLDIVFEHHHGGMFVLIYSFAVVEVSGENLGPVVQAIAKGLCTRVVEASGERSARPSMTPMISSIRSLSGAHAEP